MYCRHWGEAGLQPAAAQVGRVFTQQLAAAAPFALSRIAGCEQSENSSLQV